MVSERTGFEYFGYVGSDKTHNGFVSLGRDFDVVSYAMCLIDNIYVTMWVWDLISRMLIGSLDCWEACWKGT